VFVGAGAERRSRHNLLAFHFNSHPHLFERNIHTHTKGRWKVRKKVRGAQLLACSSVGAASVFFFSVLPTVHY